ncbi:MAG: 3-dehydroquinate synthase [gamma proteobacterium symbiont of Bathyaustriella thionipta]|nr:3-dehydroquinate synthase [gamma proteobacterium symbiont of Bathyaustriella thionipta]MCU7948563.1 3-dehydroquinate synthase [gamma proteobacterium symbiont of Bathyaustriella thionipta]MCU7954478.1 3-dehydroquinate synthase [gamma proteobacterium symbiont of Bathyaustriella thionipta]MCU7955159.1 3-dehydroquinate synthase [gamma proteobacterium symbiont of Bathyaustriella thionipta]MCU7968808.1 3-dehydroquinate synthase [gamma proteobacterium symbiont of Bathyaustriella thionipta]
MITLNVDLEERSYPIFIGQDLLDDKSLISPYVSGKQVVIVTNETIAPLYLDKVFALFSDYQCETVILPDGEIYKTYEGILPIIDRLMEKQFDRRVTLVALGGGVIGDMTGYAAAIYRRGVNFIQIPTTLLAQVDSSVGGKTGVNHPLGKNMIGAFHQPQCVLADTNTLNTLDDRQLSAGLAEVIKYALINSKEFFVWLNNNMPALKDRESEALAYAIEFSCRDKAEVVAADEKEAGQRALLNLGHTFGHAIETGLGYGNCLHGEAVAIGMIMAADLSVRHGWIDQSVQQQIIELIGAANLPTQVPTTHNVKISVKQFIDLMAGDKKVLDGQLHLILLNTLGNSFITADFELDKLKQTLEAFATG